MSFCFFQNPINIPPASTPNPLISRDDALKMITDFCHQNPHPLLCIVGPTASGKTDFSLKIAEKIGGEIINADSRQFYRGMNIGTAKITTAEMRGIPHHALDFLDPDTPFSVGEFFPLAESLIADIFARGKIPLLVGGSGLFVDAIRKNFEIPAVSPDADFRREMEQKTEDELFSLLHQSDPKSAEKIGKNRKRNIIRALEVFSKTGKRFSDLRKMASKKYNDLLFSLWIPPEILSRRIEIRAEMMFKQGFLSEVQALVRLGFSEKSTAMVAHGYREAMAFFRGEITESEMREQMIIATRQYAKRQRTWWRAQAEVICSRSL